MQRKNNISQNTIDYGATRELIFTLIRIIDRNWEPSYTDVTDFIRRIRDDRSTEEVHFIRQEES